MYVDKEPLQQFHDVHIDKTRALFENIPLGELIPELITLFYTVGLCTLMKVNNPVMIEKIYEIQSHISIMRCIYGFVTYLK